MSFGTKTRRANILVGLVAVLLVFSFVQAHWLVAVRASDILNYRVRLEGGLKGRISVTLTNEDDASESFVKEITGGTAVFESGIDSEKTYTLTVSGVIGYEDYTVNSIEPNGDGYDVSDLTELDRVVVTGNVKDENGKAYTGGGDVYYTGYEEGSLSLDEDGAFSFEAYEGKDYTVTVRPDDPAYGEYVTGTDNADWPALGDITLGKRKFEITKSIEGSGLINIVGSKSDEVEDGETVEYGEDVTVTVEAGEGYYIKELLIDGDEVPEAVGKNLYNYQFDDVNVTHTVNATFEEDAYRIWFDFDDGIELDRGDNPPIAELTREDDRSVTQRRPLKFDNENGFFAVFNKSFVNINKGYLLTIEGITIGTKKHVVKKVIKEQTLDGSDVNIEIMDKGQEKSLFELVTVSGSVMIYKDGAEVGLYNGKGEVTYIYEGAGYTVEGQAEPLDDNGLFSFKGLYKGEKYKVCVKIEDDSFKQVDLDKSFEAQNGANWDIGIQKKTFTITTAIPEGQEDRGEIDGPTPPDSVEYGNNTVTVTVRAGKGYRIDKVEVMVNDSDEEIVEAEKVYTITKHNEDSCWEYKFTNITEHYKVNAYFEEKMYDITVEFSEDGKVAYSIDEDVKKYMTSPGSFKVQEGNSVKLSLEPLLNYHVESIQLDGAPIDPDEDSPYVQRDSEGTNIVTLHHLSDVKSNHSIQIIFGIDKNGADTSINKGGEVWYKIDDGDKERLDERTIITVPYGKNLYFYIRADDGYIFTIEAKQKNKPEEKLSGILYDGEFTYKFSDIVEESYVYITFERIDEDPPDNDDWENYVQIEEDAKVLYSSGDEKETWFLKKEASFQIYYDAKSDFYVKYGENYYNKTNPREVGETTFFSKEGIEFYIAKKLIYEVDGDQFIGWKEYKAIKLNSSVHVVIDNDVPKVMDLKKDPGSDWANEDVTVSFSAEDDDKKDDFNLPSGLAYVGWRRTETTPDYKDLTLVNLNGETGQYEFVVENDTQDQTYYIYAVDKAGNFSKPAPINIKIDTTKPKIEELYPAKQPSSTLDGEDIKELPFGTFFKESIDIVVNADDPEALDLFTNEPVLSGLAKAFLKDLGTGGFINKEARIELDRGKYEGVSAYVTDHAGNKSDESSYGGPNTPIIIESGLPTAKITLKDKDDKEGYEDTRDNRLWFADNVNLTVKVQDTGDFVSGLNSFEVKLNDGEIKSWSVEYEDVQAIETDQEIELNNLSLNEGENTIIVTAEDNAGNILSEGKEVVNVFKDTKSPNITSFEFEDINNGPLSKTLNFLTFGIFFNEKTLVTVTSEENTDYDYSGLKSIKLYTGDIMYDEIVSKDRDRLATFRATFTLPKSEVLSDTRMFDKTLSAVATDNVGNATETPVFPTSVNSDIRDNKLMIEAINPKISITTDDSVYTDGRGRSWHSRDVDFDVVVEDEDSGIRSVAVTINGEEVATDKNGKSISSKFYMNETHKEAFVISAGKATRSEDGSYTISVTATDNAGNEYLAPAVVVNKDLDDPYIYEFAFKAAGTQESDGSEMSVEKTDYGFYFLEDTNVTIKARDDDPSSGIKSVTYYTVDADQGKSEERVMDAVDGEISVVITADFKGQIYALPTDNVNNEPDDFVNPDGVITERPEKHRMETHITFETAYTEYRDNNGFDLYAADTDVILTVTDTYSGLRSVEWAVTAPYDAGANQSGAFEIANDKSYVSGGDVSGWEQTRGDENLVTEMARTITVTNNSNDIRVWARITDRSGNVSEDEIVFSIDKTEPAVEVVYDNNSPDSQFTDFYSAARTAVITVAERNFTPKDVVAVIVNDEGVAPSLSEWDTVVNADDPDKTTHVARIRYLDDGRYSFSVKYKDNASNAAKEFPRQSFIIDKTAPVISVTYNNNAPNGKYYNAARTATITIDEHNFETGRVLVSGTAVNRGAPFPYPAVSQWASNGDRRIASITYSSDAEYDLSVAYTDKAGNAAVNYEQEPFFLDATAPLLTISGVRHQSANNGVVAPVITYSDTNLVQESVKISLVGANKGPVKLNGEYAKNGDAYTYVFKDFARTKENDDIYSLDVDLTDLAGNQTTQNVMFSVNRFGSVYTFDEQLKSVAGKYVQNEIDVIVTETNVDSLKNDTAKPKLIINGTPKDLREDADYFVKKTGGGGQWSQYTYTLPKELFAGDGRYNVFLYSEDAAGNINENADEIRRAEISFGIDKTPPLVMAVDIENGKQYAVDEKDATFLVKDNLALEAVTAYLNGEKIEAVLDGENYAFNVTNSNAMQFAMVSARDAAGNEHVLNVEDFLVTTNLFYRWYYNDKLFAGTLISFGLLLLLLLALVIVSWRRKNRENA
ncbi:MAG: hypothetical protein LBL35_09060 [Clostridiales bacterium]|jgi:hypothetical protein|nr:hypothetical protein [Clostridiales bacterium]